VVQDHLLLARNVEFRLERKLQQRASHRLVDGDCVLGHLETRFVRPPGLIDDADAEGRQVIEEEVHEVVRVEDHDDIGRHGLDLLADAGVQSPSGRGRTFFEHLLGGHRIVGHTDAHDDLAHAAAAFCSDWKAGATSRANSSRDRSVASWLSPPKWNVPPMWVRPRVSLQ
jgi:hypothetical protein